MTQRESSQRQPDGTQWRTREAIAQTIGGGRKFKYPLHGHYFSEPLKTQLINSTMTVPAALLILSRIMLYGHFNLHHDKGLVS